MLVDSVTMAWTFFFKLDHADVLASDGSVILGFERQVGGLYVAKLKLKRPNNAFDRQG